MKSPGFRDRVFKDGVFGAWGFEVGGCMGLQMFLVRCLYMAGNNSSKQQGGSCTKHRRQMHKHTGFPNASTLCLPECPV